MLSRIERAVQAARQRSLKKHLRDAESRLYWLARGLLSSPGEALRDAMDEVWNTADDEEHRRAISHWRGVGRWADTESWAAIGKKSLRDFDRLARWLNEPAFRKKKHNILEWGPGGGSNMLALSPHAKRLYGVDISDKNLGECQRILTELGPDGGDQLLTPVLIGDDPEEVKNHVDEPLDAVLSTAVFQHFPNKEYGVRVLQTLASIMRPRALGAIQIRFDNGNPKYRPKSATEYARHHITATSYGIDEFWVALRDNGFVPQLVQRIDSRINYATFLFFRR